MYKLVFWEEAADEGVLSTSDAVFLWPLRISGSPLPLACTKPSLQSQRMHVHCPWRSKASSLA
nr:hypothetical protein Iba_scaffold7259CG0130 [Ipomoea batatas]